MWLARRKGVQPSVARAWYTHARAEKLKRQLRRFTGMVSAQTLRDPGQALVLEHYEGIQRRLTRMVSEHLKGEGDVADFIALLIECEQVHIVTRAENYAAAKARGDYAMAGIELVPWSRIDVNVRDYLWKRVLNGRVANAADFSPMVQAAADDGCASASQPNEEERWLEACCRAYAEEHGLAASLIPMSGYFEPRVALRRSTTGILQGVAARIRLRRRPERRVCAYSILVTAEAAEFGAAKSCADPQMASEVDLGAWPVAEEAVNRFLDAAVAKRKMRESARKKE